MKAQQGMPKDVVTSVNHCHNLCLFNVHPNLYLYLSTLNINSAVKLYSVLVFNSEAGGIAPYFVHTS